jgi:hypothetical protein
MSHAVVQISGRTVADIQQTATAVFREEGYALSLNTAEMMVFERPGSRRDAIKWGDIGGRGVTMRVMVKLSTTLDGGQLLRTPTPCRFRTTPFFNPKAATSS